MSGGLIHATSIWEESDRGHAGPGTNQGVAKLSFLPEGHPDLATCHNCTLNDEADCEAHLDCPFTLPPKRRSLERERDAAPLHDAQETAERKRQRVRNIAKSIVARDMILAERKARGAP